MLKGKKPRCAPISNREERAKAGKAAWRVLCGDADSAVLQIFGDDGKSDGGDAVATPRRFRKAARLSEGPWVWRSIQERPDLRTRRHADRSLTRGHADTSSAKRKARELISHKKRRSRILCSPGAGIP